MLVTVVSNAAELYALPWELQAGLTERMLADVGGEPGALPLLQYTLDRLWEKRRGRTLSADVYKELGGVVGALQQKAEDGGKATVEVAHEALIRTWERLREWLREDVDKLSELQKIETWVEQWQEHGTLLSGAQLGYATEVAANYPDDIDGPTRTLIDKSQAWAAFVERLKLMGVVAIMTTLVVIAIGAYIAYGRLVSASRDQMARPS